MQTYNNIANAIFDFLFAPFGHEIALFDLIVWPVIMGIGALLVYKYTSNQGAIARVKRQISMHLLEIRLFRDDIAQVLTSTLKIIAKNVIYIAHNLTPMAVMLEDGLPGIVNIRKEIDCSYDWITDQQSR